MYQHFVEIHNQMIITPDMTEEEIILEQSVEVPTVKVKEDPTASGDQGWKFMSCSQCQELGQQASWPLIG